MDDKNSSNVQHPLHAALMIFHATVRTAFETAAASAAPNGLVSGGQQELVEGSGGPDC